MRRKSRKNSAITYFIVVVISVVCYLNSLDGDFVHDDIPAISLNADVLGTSSVTQLCRNDFWGTPMSDTNSHKSYRPLTVLTFSVCEPAGYDPFGVVEKRLDVIQACGTLLADILTRTCTGLYREQDANKYRYPTNSENVIQDAEYEYDYNTYPYVKARTPFRSKRSATSFLEVSRPKRKSGVVDKCCRKPCTFGELKLYCG